MLTADYLGRMRTRSENRRGSASTFCQVARAQIYGLRTELAHAALAMAILDGGATLAS
jgi:hypothetical protein